MSRENVEVVRELLAEFAVTRRAVARLSTPDFVWTMGTFAGWPDEPDFIGPEAFNEFFARWTEAYEEWEIDVPELHDVGDDRVVAILTQRGRPRGTDSWVELQYGMIYTLSGGLVSRVEAFATVAEALEAAGLPE